MAQFEPFSLLEDVINKRDQLADPTDTSLEAQVGRAVCDAYASAPRAFQVVGEVSAPGALGAAANTVCGPYWAGEGTDAPQEVSQGFTGGQCPCDEYTVAFGWDGGNGFAQQGDAVLPGPIGPLTTQDDDIFIVAGAEACGGNRPIQVASGQPQVAIDSARIISATPRFGGPDVCGDPPPVIEPGPSNPGTPPGTPITRPVGGTPVDIEVRDPLIDIDGTVYVEVNTEFGDFNVNFDVGAPRLPRRPDPPNQEGNEQEPGTPTGDVDDDITEEEEEAGFETLGYRWEVRNVPMGLGRIIGAVPETFPRVVGNVRLRHQTESGLTYFGEDVRVSAVEGSVFRRDSTEKVVGVSYNFLPELGGIVLTPIRGRKVEDVS